MLGHPLPIPHRILEKLGEVFFCGRTRRELGDTMLRQGTFDKSRNVVSRVTHSSKAIGDM